MSISTPAERIEPILTWIQAHRDAELADLQRFCRQPSISAQARLRSDGGTLPALRLAGRQWSRGRIRRFARAWSR